MFGWSWLKILNFFVLQWFFVRLARVVNDADWSVTIGWRLLQWPVPLTGWWNNYVFVGERSDQDLSIGRPDKK